MRPNLAFARTVHATANGDEFSSLIQNFDLTEADSAASADDCCRRLQVCVYSRSQKINSHVDRRDTTTKFGRKACMSRQINQSGDDFAVIVGLIRRAAQLRSVGKKDSKLSRRDIECKQFRLQPLMEWRPLQHRADEGVSVIWFFGVVH